MRLWKMHPLYQGGLDHVPESRGYRKDKHRRGYRETDVRMMGGPNRGDQIMTHNQVKQLLEHLILGKSPYVECWSDDMLGDWVNDPI
jgi:hypothetical protein